MPNFLTQRVIPPPFPFICTPHSLSATPFFSLSTTSLYLHHSAPTHVFSTHPFIISSIHSDPILYLQLPFLSNLKKFLLNPPFFFYPTATTATTTDLAHHGIGSGCEADWGPQAFFKFAPPPCCLTGYTASIYTGKPNLGHGSS